MSAITHKHKSHRPDIFTYHDYRAFLNDWFEYLKSSQSLFSMRKLAKEAGIATGYISMVLRGDRSLSENTTKKLLPILNLTNEEVKFLLLLITIADSSHHDERMKALNKLQKFNSYKQQNKQDLNAYKYLSKWYNVAIREMFNLNGFKEDAQWIRDRLQKKVPLREIKLSIKFLREHSLVGRGQESNYLDCSEGIFKISLTEFYGQVFELAKKSIHLVRRDKRRILGHTMALSEEQIIELNKRIDDFFIELQSINNDAGSKTSVYQIGLLSFPVTKTQGAEE